MAGIRGTGGAANREAPADPGDVGSRAVFSAALLDHCNHPRNVGSMSSDDATVGTGWAEAQHCQDVVKLQIRVAPHDEVISSARFKTFGCTVAIACSSLATELVTGRSLTEVEAVDRHALGRVLELPSRRLACAATVEQALRLAVADYRKKSDNRT